MRASQRYCVFEMATPTLTRDEAPPGAILQHATKRRVARSIDRQRTGSGIAVFNERTAWRRCSISGSNHAHSNGIAIQPQNRHDSRRSTWSRR